MAIEENAIRELVGALSPDDEKKKSNTYSAVVSHIDNEGTVWVILAGSEKETPTASTSTEVKRGDNVTVQWRNNKLYIGGNYSNPSAGVTRVANVEQDAANAFTTAENAEQDAARAHEAAEQAEASAEEAKTQATRATRYANDSLSQLSIVEDVVGTLNWITTHATYKATEDTEVREGKWYFTKSGNTYNVVLAPSGDPSAQGWYEIDEIDEAVSNYVSSHLALTDAGLWVVKDNQGYKILLANDGMRVYDSTGHLVSTFGESITFDSERPQKIGNDNVYIEYYDSNNDRHPDSLRIKANEFRLASGNTIQDEIGKIEGLNVNMQVSGSNLVFTATLIQGGDDITDTIPDGDFEWFYRTPSGDVPMNLNGKTITIPQASQEYGRTVLCVWTRSQYTNLLTNSGNKLRTLNGAYLVGRSEY